MFKNQTESRLSNYFCAFNRRILSFLLAALVLTLLTPLASAHASRAGDKDITFATAGDINITQLFGQQVNVEKIATDSENRILVLASFSDGSADNHILFRLNQNGSYDNGFGDSGPHLNGKPYVLVTQTSLNFTFERADLEIDSEDRLLVLLSGSTNLGDDFQSQSFVKRFLESGMYDPDFGNDGTIDLVVDSEGTPVFLTDLSLDTTANENGFLVAGFAPELGFNGGSMLGLRIKKFDANGVLVGAFGNEELGETYIDTDFFFGYVDDNYEIVLVNDVRVMPDFANGYVVAYSGLPSDEFSGLIFPSSGFVRLTGDGQIDVNFAVEADDFLGNDNLFGVYALNNHLVLGALILTDLRPDHASAGQAGFLVSGTSYIPFTQNSASLLFRIKTDGTFDRSFKHSALINGQKYIINELDQDNLPSIFEQGFSCYNQALFRNIDSNESSTAIILGDSCNYENIDELDVISELIGLLKSGETDENFEPYGYSRPLISRDPPAGFLLENPDSFAKSITQLEQSKNGKILVVRGAEPTSGILGFYWRLFQHYYPEESFESVVTISLHNLRTPVSFELSRDSESATVGVAISGYTVSTIGATTPGTEATYSISPAIGNGLTFDTSTALISGVPTSTLATRDYIITGVFETLTDTGFSYTDTATATLSLTINAASTPTPPTPPVIVYVAPSPVPYLRTISSPQLRLKENKLMCTAGTYQTGSTLQGVIQLGTVSPFNPTSYRFNLLIDGITQSISAFTSGLNSASWDPVKAPAGSTVSCSVTVSALGITNIDKSTGNSIGLADALSSQNQSISAAGTAYAATVNANQKAYQKALVDNRAKWRSDTEKIRTAYYAERDRIRTLPATKATRALSSAALKAYTTAIKKSASDYKASQPASAAARDADDKAALITRDAAIAKANATYGAFIESIGYGVLIP